MLTPALFAGGAGAAPDAPADPADPDPDPDEGLLVAAAVADDAPDFAAEVDVTFPACDDAEGPTADAARLDVEPEIVARLEMILTTADVALDEAETEADGDAEGWFNKLAWIRISSHWSPIHSS